MEKYKLDTVDDMFCWKQNIKNPKNKKHIYPKSVEQVNSILTNPSNSHASLGWKNTDVLYSFLLIYYLGLKTIDSSRFEQLFQQEKEFQNNPKLCRYSTKFLHKCSKDEKFKEFNKSPQLVEFINNYFSIGNVIPIWPGGNEARGKMGLYDIPELFFNEHKLWAQALCRQYPNAFIDEVIKNDTFLVIYKKDNFCTLKGYNNSFKNLKEFENCVKENTDIKNYTGFYFDYMQRRTAIIKTREVKLMEWLKNNS